MGIRVALRHVTSYKYDRPVTLNPHVIRLRPAPHTRTPVSAYSIDIEPKPHFLNWQQDPYSNYLARLVFLKPGQEFKVTIDLIADLSPINPFDFFIEEAAEKFPFAYEPALKQELAPYLETLPVGPKLQALIAASHKTGLKTIDYVVELNRDLSSRIGYVIRMEPGVQTPEETLTIGKGSCRDSAWLLVQLCRNLGIAARFCSGYLLQLVADEKPLEGPEGPTADFTDLHAWTEVYLPGAGWVGLDPTSGLMTAEGHIPLACSADPRSASPIEGTYAWSKKTDVEDDKLGEEFKFHMSVTRLEEAPRVTKPYTEAQWQAIDALGRYVDSDLREWDVRLTMGGEPTFVGIDNRDAAEWNTEAMGPTKRLIGGELLQRLRDRFTNGGLLHFGQGKWYPGESLPRWAFSCYWRKDGGAIWNDPALVADERVPSHFTSADAKTFIVELAKNLDVDSACALPGYEDAWYYMWRERRLPTNVDPLNNRLDDEEERTRLSRVFEQQLGSVVGYAIPLRRNYSAGRPKWETGNWFLRKEHLFLMPGDSPMGLRLPLDSIPWEPTENRQFMEPLDPFAPRGPLPTTRRMQFQGVIPSGNEADADKGLPTALSQKTPTSRDLTKDHNGFPNLNGTADRSADRNGEYPTNRIRTALAGGPDDNSHGVVRTALCVEPRKGIMHVFLPPARFLEDYLDLVAAVEDTAAALKIPVLIEGYKPPSDSRLNHLSVTPDPGVIEVNIHPANDWRECVDFSTVVYEEARLSRLTTEKFMLDGRHTGTGGGNHIVVGGPTAAESPFLRRPDLIRSLVSFWINHPSLSYLFSGLFVGPTSQHPRIDEARHDALRELEIAFGQLPPDFAPPPPAWLVDRLFRHLLTDSTGNTHRTEFCIDKLYSPDTAEGRRGLVELRSFEMPPHVRMSCAQQLLMRSLIAWFWKKPYQRSLVRWGTRLHDQFMMPHFVREDLHDALDEIRQDGGYHFDTAWFEPHFEFRFPVVGIIRNRGVQLELRTAIEPWHVLGEESGGGGTARYVDSSVERVQVKARNLTDPRHVITCNGRRVPLHPTGTAGEYVAGVRFRAWQPPSCLHPTIGVHSPLVFDILDTWNDRSIGGCTYHVSHPGGRASETLPVNSLEAESRRIARFFPFGHTPGTVTVPPDEVNPEFPLTLDLRLPEPLSSSAPVSRVPRPGRARASVV